MRVATSFCVCGHPLGYHDARELADLGTAELCSVWGCGCVEYEPVTEREVGD